MPLTACLFVFGVPLHCPCPHLVPSQVFDAPQSLGGGPDDVMVPGYADFLPPGTYINVGDFGSVAALGRHLTELSRNETAYNELLWTRRAGTSVDAIKKRWFQHRSYGGGSKSWLTDAGKVVDTRCRLARAAIRTGGGGAGTMTSTSFSPKCRAFSSSMPLVTRRALCSTWCPC